MSSLQTKIIAIGLIALSVAQLLLNHQLMQLEHNIKKECLVNTQEK